MSTIKHWNETHFQLLHYIFFILIVWLLNKIAACLQSEYDCFFFRFHEIEPLNTICEMIVFGLWLQICLCKIIWSALHFMRSDSFFWEFLNMQNILNFKSKRCKKLNIRQKIPSAICIFSFNNFLSMQFMLIFHLIAILWQMIMWTKNYVIFSQWKKKDLLIPRYLVTIITSCELHRIQIKLNI